MVPSLRNDKLYIAHYSSPQTSRISRICDEKTPCTAPRQLLMLQLKVPENRAYFKHYDIFLRRPFLYSTSKGWSHLQQAMYYHILMVYTQKLITQKWPKTLPVCFVKVHTHLRNHALLDNSSRTDLYLDWFTISFTELPVFGLGCTEDVITIGGKIKVWWPISMAG